MSAEATITAETTGVILAGGASSRFGSNKALALLHGTHIIRHVASTLENLFPQHLLVTNSPDTYRFLGWPMVGDIHTDSGPLAGIQAALHNMVTAQAFIVGCDMPIIDSRLISYLCNLAGNWDAAVPWLDAGPEPLYAVYRKSCLPVIDRQLREKKGKIRLTLEQLKLHKVTEQEVLAITGDLTTFHNINRVGDLQFLMEKVTNCG
ncbi:MAG: molybdenum cofactor guanylyltransferase [Proteobacteria bacterium]|nr:molybdenum cofactor guanylyltransferase [Pseudomonadota bacterium]MBU0966545.1 molybdenum cofactor guanylyltransferase [Pseudomonadota bacterium]